MFNYVEFIINKWISELIRVGWSFNDSDIRYSEKLRTCSSFRNSKLKYKRNSPKNKIHNTQRRWIFWSKDRIKKLTKLCVSVYHFIENKIRWSSNDAYENKTLIRDGSMFFMNIRNLPCIPHKWMLQNEILLLVLRILYTSGSSRIEKRIVENFDNSYKLGIDL